MNMVAGAVVIDGVLYFQSLTKNGSDTNSSLYQMQRSADVGRYGYTDHDAAITATWRSHWESLGNPELFKRFLRCRISSDETRLASSSSMDLNTYVDYSTANQSTDDTLTWTTQLSQKPKIKAELCQGMMTEFTSATRFTPWIVTGYVLEAVANFRQEMKE